MSDANEWYWRTTIECADAGDVDAAREVHNSFCWSVESGGLVFEPGVLEFVARGVRGALDGMDAGKALGLTQRRKGRRRNPDREDGRIAIARAVLHRRREVGTLKAAKLAVAASEDRSLRDVERCWRDYRFPNFLRPVTCL